MTTPTTPVRKATKAVAKKATKAASRKAATPKAETLVVEMEYSKATSGTYVYSEVEDGTPVRTLYVRKDAFAKAPNSITVTITAK